MTEGRPVATLEPVRFGEFLLTRNLLTDEQWLAALADHWSGAITGRHRRIGTTIVEWGFLEPETIEAEARAFHDELEVIEVMPRSEAVTVPPPFRA